MIAYRTNPHVDKRERGAEAADLLNEIFAGALLELVDSGLRVVVGTLRRQLAETVMLEMHGIDIAKIQCLIVKSRGDYRVGFDGFFSDEQIMDVDSPG